MSSALLDSLSSAAIQYPDSDRSTTAPKQNFSYQELVSATKNFSTKLGGFGGVYEGIIDGTKVAIKMLSHASELSVEGYKAEVTTLGHLNHPNVVQLIGWCHHQKYVLLVYELMPNGSLDALLHRDKPVLPWFRRSEVVIFVITY
jgi:serine/threonine protein kinase